MAQILGRFQFENDRLIALEALAPRLLDQEDAAKLASTFTYETNKQRAAGPK